VSDVLPEILELLARLVAFDTRNPPRAVDGGGIFACLIEALGPGFNVDVRDIGDGCVSLFAVRGAPKIVFNVHVDTVPADAGWQGDPLRLRVEGDRAIGLGACDIKGAAACLVAAARRTKGDVALLFTSDEEAGSSRCVKDFLARERRFRGAVIGEPTRCRAVLEHRGIVSCAGTFHGVAGHASAPRALVDSAVHEALRWGARALEFAEAAESRRYKALSGVRFNLGVLNGGTKANMIASSASLRFGVRPLPDQRPEDLVAEICALAPRADRATWEIGFLAPPLPAPGRSLAASEALAQELGLPGGDPVDFWTEAALFSAEGVPAVVYGPGDIAQAHTAGEWVALDDLALAAAEYYRIISGAHAMSDSRP
jgi:acetylornithine deacetylase